MSRDSKGGCELYEDLFNHNVCIEFLKEPWINTAVYKKALDNQIKLQIKTGNEATDKLMETIIQALNDYTIALAKDQIKKVFDQAQKELEDIHQRTKEGMFTARLNRQTDRKVARNKSRNKKSKGNKGNYIKTLQNFWRKLNR